MTLAGAVSKRFRPYFDLYPLEVSTDLVDWQPLVTLGRTNSSTNALAYTDSTVGNSGQRFYRTPTHHFIAPLTRPTGPFAAGVVSRVITDPNRRNRFRVSTNGSFPVSIWYPGVAQAGVRPAPLEDPQLARDPNWPSWYTYGNVGLQCKDREPEFVSHALLDIAFAVEAAPCPVLIYSPGGWGNGSEIAGRGPQLASHGFVVVTGDPADVYASAFPDGQYLYGDGSVCITDAGFADRVNDLRLILDELSRWNRDDPVLAGRLQVTNVASMGWSWGAGVAAEFCRVDTRCQAAIILEGYFQNAAKVLSAGLPKPCLFIYADPITIPGIELQLYHKAAHDAVWFQIRSTIHDVFGDTYWAAGGSELGATVAPIIDAYTLWFLNKYLKGSNEPVPAREDFPRVINFKQK